jgi:hypothetical protein
MIGSHEDKYACAAFSSEEKAESFVKSFNHADDGIATPFRTPREEVWIAEDLELDGPPKFCSL